jgi:hypothetical protein
MHPVYLHTQTETKWAHSRRIKTAITLQGRLLLLLLGMLLLLLSTVPSPSSSSCCCWCRWNRYVAVHCIPVQLPSCCSLTDQTPLFSHCYYCCSHLLQQQLVLSLHSAGRPALLHLVPTTRYRCCCCSSCCCAGMWARWLSNAPQSCASPAASSLSRSPSSPSMLLLLPPAAAIDPVTQ